MIGFSAGAMTTMLVAMAPDPAVRPDFAASLYGALLAKARPGKDAPPIFIAAAQDDSELSPTKSVGIFEAWTKGGSQAELHIYEKGGHGFGFRAHHVSSDHWPDDFYAWLASHHLVQPAGSQRGAGSR